MTTICHHNPVKTGYSLYTGLRREITPNRSTICRLHSDVEMSCWIAFFSGFFFYDLKCTKDENFSSRRIVWLSSGKIKSPSFQRLSKGMQYCQAGVWKPKGRPFFQRTVPWGWGCVGGFVGSINLVPRVEERVGEPMRTSLVGLCWYRLAKEAGGRGEGGAPITHHADILYAITHRREKMTRECGVIALSVHGNISAH